MFRFLTIPFLSLSITFLASAQRPGETRPLYPFPKIPSHILYGKNVGAPVDPNSENVGDRTSRKPVDAPNLHLVVELQAVARRGDWEATLRKVKDVHSRGLDIDRALSVLDPFLLKPIIRKATSGHLERSYGLSEFNQVWEMVRDYPWTNDTLVHLVELAAKLPPTMRPSLTKALGPNVKYAEPLSIEHRERLREPTKTLLNSPNSGDRSLALGVLDLARPDDIGKTIGGLLREYPRTSPEFLEALGIAAKLGDSSAQDQLNALHASSDVRESEIAEKIVESGNKEGIQHLVEVAQRQPWNERLHEVLLKSSDAAVRKAVLEIPNSDRGVAELAANLDVPLKEAEAEFLRRLDGSFKEIAAASELASRGSEIGKSWLLNLVAPKDDMTEKTADERETERSRKLEAIRLMSWKKDLFGSDLKRLLRENPDDDDLRNAIIANQSTFDPILEEDGSPVLEDSSEPQSGVCTAKVQNNFQTDLSLSLLNRDLSGPDEEYAFEGVVPSEGLIGTLDRIQVGEVKWEETPISAEYFTTDGGDVVRLNRTQSSHSEDLTNLLAEIELTYETQVVIKKILSYPGLIDPDIPIDEVLFDHEQGSADGIVWFFTDEYSPIGLKFERYVEGESGMGCEARSESVEASTESVSSESTFSEEASGVEGR